MPTPLEQSLAIILGPDSKLRDKTPRVYALPEQLPESFNNMKRMRFLDHDLCGSRNVKKWLRRDIGEIRLQSIPLNKEKDQSEIFTTIRQPHERWWSGIRDFMHMLPWYAWWLNDKMMAQWPHFHRATLRMHDYIEEIKPQHYIKVDQNFGTRMENFARRHCLPMYGALPYMKPLRHTRDDYRQMENKGRSQLEAWLKKNPTYQKQLDDYLEPDYAYWDRVKNQD